MKALWTPWRIEHVRGNSEAPPGCLFAPPTTEAHSKQHLLLYQDGRTLCLLNRFPYSNGHLLVAPAAHVGCLTELTPAQTAPLMELVSQATAILKAQLHPDGFNIGLNIGSEAGAGISDHLHFHIVPRWRGDHNFMTTLADVRTIPEHIDRTFDTLLPDFQAYFKNKNQPL
jgi:ATP adenylyltransferase